MFERERPSVGTVDEQHVFLQRLGERQVRRVAVVAVAEDVGRRIVGQREGAHGGKAHAAPRDVEARPAGDAVEIARVVDLLQGEQALPVEDERVRAGAVYPQRPVRFGEVRRDAEVEHRPLARLCRRLARWQLRHPVSVRRPVSEGAGVGERRRRGGALEEALAEPEAGREHPRIDAGRISFVLRRHSLP